MASMATETAAAVAVTSGEETKKEFMVEMRTAAIRLHSKDQYREGMAEAQKPPVTKWNPTVEGYIRFLVDVKLVFETLEAIVNRAAIPWYAALQNTGLEKSESIKELEWFRQQGYMVPEPAAPGITYSSFLETVSKQDPQAFTCHFYNSYFGIAGGGRIIGRKVTEKINNKETEIFKWDSMQLQEEEVRGKLNNVTSAWSRQEKDRCLAEIEKSFAYSRNLRRCLI